jgi:hypothetical protein
VELPDQRVELRGGGHRLLEVDRRQLLPLVDHLGQPPADPPQLVAQRLPAIERPGLPVGDRPDEQGQEVVEDLLEQLLFAVVIQVEGPLGDPDLGDDVGDLGGVKTPLGEDVDRRRLQRLSPLVGLALLLPLPKLLSAGRTVPIGPTFGLPVCLVCLIADASLPRLSPAGSLFRDIGEWPSGEKRDAAIASRVSEY